jgi:hypothetical protein
MDFQKADPSAPLVPRLELSADPLEEDTFAVEELAVEPFHPHLQLSSGDLVN